MENVNLGLQNEPKAENVRACAQNEPGVIARAKVAENVQTSGQNQPNESQAVELSRLELELWKMSV